MSAKPSRLGRGLDALIPTTLDTKTDKEVAAALQLDETQVVKIPVSDIDPNPHQPRKEFGDEELKELSNSIGQHGVLQPIIVVQVNGGRYQLIAGERRLRATKLAGKKTIPALVRSFDEQDTLQVAVVENIQRAELSVLELAVAYQKLADQFNLTPDEIGPQVGKHPSTVRNTLRLLNLPYEAKKALLDNSITEGHARAILSVDDPTQQQELLKMVLAKDLTVRATEALSRNYRADKVLVSERVQKVESSYTSAITGLSKSLGTKVEITKNSQGGRVVLRFFSEEELQRMYEQITGETLL